MEYAISDIHGYYTTFRYLIEERIKLQKEDTLYLLGDYIDRGTDSKGVLDYILALQEKGFQVRTLMGNHELLLLESLNDADTYSLWLQNGGTETLYSFGIRSANQLPAEYNVFLNSLEYYFETDKYFLVHAGFDFSTPDFLTNKEAMLWIRRWHHTIDRDRLKGKTIVHGHTPTPLVEIQNMLDENLYPVINIDGGCFVKKEGYGNLCALNLTTRELIWQKRLPTT